LWWIGGVCARKVEKLMMTPFIVGLQENYGVHFSICLVLFRLCLEGERDVGELGEDKWENHNALEVLRLAPLCLIWCLWREQNVRSIKDQENAMLEQKKMFQFLYTWIAAFNSLPVCNFSKFLDSCSSFSPY
jgi:hypothetical protein